MPDMFSEGDRSIRKIPITTSHHSASIDSMERTAPIPGRHRRQRNSLFSLGLLVVLVCALASFLLSTLFETARVSITLKTQEITLSGRALVSQDTSPAGGLSYTYVSTDPLPEGVIPIQGSLSGGKIAAIAAADLARVAAKQMITGYQGEPVTLADTSTIVASVGSSTPTFGRMVVALSGTSTLLWQVDEHTLAQALAGKKRSDFTAIIKTFGQSITEAHLTMRPFWKSTLPSNENKIEVAILKP